MWGFPTITAQDCCSSNILGAEQPKKLQDFSKIFKKIRKKDAGDNNSPPISLDTDIDGEERIFEGTIDIGADEVATNPLNWNNDGIIDYHELEVLTGEWLQSGGQLQSDSYNDDFIDFADFSIFAREWLWKGGWYE